MTFTFYQDKFKFSTFQNLFIALNFFSAYELLVIQHPIENLSINRRVISIILINIQIVLW